MKLAIIVTHRENEKDLEKALVEKKFQLTRLESRGGFLKQKNTTFLLGLEEDKLNEVLEIVKKVCPVHEEFLAGAFPDVAGLGENVALDGEATKIKAGGATVFVVNVDKFLKV